MVGLTWKGVLHSGQLEKGFGEATKLGEAFDDRGVSVVW